MSGHDRRWAVAVVLALMGCAPSTEPTNPDREQAQGPSPGQAQAQSPERETNGTGVDEIPDPDLHGMEPRVAELLQRLRDELVEDPANAAPWGALGAAYHAHGLHDDAEACYRRAGDLDDGDFRWAYLLAIVREVNGARVEELIERFDSAAGLRADYAPLFERSGLALSKRGDFPSAREALERAIELDPDSPLPHRALGQVLLALDDARGALAHLERARELAPNDGAVYSSLAQAELRLGNPDRARRAADRARALKVSHSVRDPLLAQEVYALGASAAYGFSRGLALIRRGEFGAAVDELLPVAEVKPDDFDVRFLLGMALLRDGRGDAALGHLLAAVELKPDHAAARMELARLQESRHDPSAASHYRQAAQSAPRDIRVWIEAGTALGRLGQYDPAEALLRDAVRLAPRNADAHYRLGELLQVLGRNADARKHYAAAVGIDPGHAAGRRLGEVSR